MGKVGIQLHLELEVTSTSANKLNHKSWQTNLGEIVLQKESSYSLTFNPATKA